MGNWLSTLTAAVKTDSYRSVISMRAMDDLLSTRNNALVQAVEANDCERVKRLLDEGADVNAKNDAGKPCLVIAAKNQADLEIIRLLVSAPGVDVNAKDSVGSALNYAVYNDDFDTTKVLLEHGAQLDYHCRHRLS